MKKNQAPLFFCFAALVLILTSMGAALFFSPPARAADIPSHPPIKVFVDGLKIDFDVEPVVMNQRTMVPFRAIAEALQIDVAWDGTTQTVAGASGPIFLRLQIGNARGYINDVAHALDAPPVILGGRTLLPLRFFSEALGCQVAWEEKSREVHISSPPKAMAITGFYALGDSNTSSWTDLFGASYPQVSQDYRQGNTDLVNEVALGWYSLDENGNILTKSRTGWQRPTGWERVLSTLKQHNLKSDLVVHLTDKDRAIRNILENSAAVSTAVESIAAESTLYQGVNLDFEGLGWQEKPQELQNTRANYSNFVRLLYNKLKTKGKTLTLTLHAPNSAYQGYDYRELGRTCDRIIIMAYDYGAVPEPLDLVGEAVVQAIAQVPAEKLVLGISLPNETPESIRSKVGLAKRYGLAGLSLWRLGLLTDEMSASLRSLIIPRF